MSDSRRDQRRIDLGDLAFGRFQRGLSASNCPAVNSTSPFFTACAEADIDLGDAAGAFGQDRHRPEVERCRGGRRMEVEDHRDQRDRQHQAAGDAPSQFVPDGEERDLLAEPLALPIAAVEVIGKDRHQRADHELKHGCATSCLGGAASAPAVAGGGISSGVRLVSRVARRGVGDTLDGIGNAAHRRAEIRQVDHGEQQARDPEDMHVGKERDQAEHGDDLELQLLRLVRHALGQAVQFPVQRTDPQNGRRPGKCPSPPSGCPTRRRRERKNGR